MSGACNMTKRGEAEESDGSCLAVQCVAGDPARSFPRLCSEPPGAAAGKASPNLLGCGWERRGTVMSWGWQSHSYVPQSRAAAPVCGSGSSRPTSGLVLEVFKLYVVSVDKDTLKN